MIKYILLVALSGIALSTSAQSKTAQPATGESAIEKPITDSLLIFHYVEQMPQPPFDLGTYLSQNIHYPKSAKAHGIEGRVIIRFIINDDGRIYDCTALTHIGYGLEEEGMRVIAAMPRWRPGRQNGKAVKVYFTQPLNFKLDDPIKTKG